jgi:hypothetical protein
MLNQMNKHINHLSMAKLMGIEQKEHGLAKAPTKEQFRINEMREHKLGGVPSLRVAMEAEASEHAGPEGQIVIRGSGRQRSAAQKIYQGRGR